MPGLRVGAAVVAVGTFLVASGCARPEQQASTTDPSVPQRISDSQQPNPIAGGSPALFNDLEQVAGRPITDIPSGLRPDAPAQTRTVVNTDGGAIDRLAAVAIGDVEEFWSGAYGPPLSGRYTPVAALFSWDSTDESQKGAFCGSETAGYVNAAFCWGETDNCTPAGSCSSAYNTIGWDRVRMIPDEQRTFGDAAVAIATMAHEYGHAIQHVMSDLKPRRSIVSEQQADCFAGIYARWVTDGKSPAFTLNTGEGLNKVLADVAGAGDPAPTVQERKKDLGLLEHGSAFERISAFEKGFNDGTAACVGINEEEIAARRGNLPVALQTGESGENPITEDSLSTFVEVLNTVFAPTDPPALSFSAPTCSDARSSAPTSYCPSTDTVYADVSALADQAISITGDAGVKLMTLPLFGDYTAYSAVASRYALAVQKQRGLNLDSESAGLRTACLTGAATAAISNGVTVSGGPTIRLTAGDLDEAVNGLLVNGLIAADVNGDYTPNGFARVAAFRTGVLGDQDTCLKTFP